MAASKAPRRPLERLSEEVAPVQVHTGSDGARLALAGAQR